VKEGVTEILLASPVPFPYSDPYTKILSAGPPVTKSTSAAPAPVPSKAS